MTQVQQRTRVAAFSFVLSRHPLKATTFHFLSANLSSLSGSALIPILRRRHLGRLALIRKKFDLFLTEEQTRKTYIYDKRLRKMESSKQTTSFLLTCHSQWIGVVRRRQKKQYTTSSWQGQMDRIELLSCSRKRWRWTRIGSRIKYPLITERSHLPTTRTPI